MDSRHINPIRSIFLKKIFFFLLLIGTVLVRSGTGKRQTKLLETKLKRHSYDTRLILVPPPVLVVDTVMCCPVPASLKLFPGLLGVLPADGLPLLTRPQLPQGWLRQGRAALPTVTPLPWAAIPDDCRWQE